MSALRNVLELPFSVSLPADPDEAAFVVVALIETSDIDLSGQAETIVKCNGRYFMVIWGAGRDLVEVSSFAAQPDDYAERHPYDEPAMNEWPVDAGDFDPYRDIPAYQLQHSIDDALSIEFYMDAERLRATGMAARPGVSRRFQKLFFGLCSVVVLAIAITIVGALADDGMERCQQTASFDTCFTALNR